MTKQAFCKCGGVVVARSYEESLAYYEVETENGDDWQQGEELDHECYNTEHGGFLCLDCNAEFEDLTSAIKDGRIVLLPILAEGNHDEGGET